MLLLQSVLCWDYVDDFLMAFSFIHCTLIFLNWQNIFLQINETILTVFERFVTENADRMQDLFLQMDKDKSGDITLEEFKYGLKDFGLRLTSVSGI